MQYIDLKLVNTRKIEQNCNWPHSAHYLSKPVVFSRVMVEPFRLCGLVFISLCIAVTLAGSLLIYIAFSKKSSLRNNSNALFLSLVTADLMTALTVMPVELVDLWYYPQWPLGATMCRLWSTLFVAFALLSVITLAIISLERLLALKRPFHYDCSVVSTKVLVILSSLWLYGFLTGVASFFAWDIDDNSNECKSLSVGLEYGIPLLLINVLLPYGTCIVTYTLIFRISRSHVRNITSFEENGNNVVKGRRKNIIALLLTRKSTITLGLLVGSFTICCMPFFIFHVIDAVMEEKISYRYHSENVMKWLVFFSGSTNWALYGLLNRDFRQAMLKILRRFQVKNDSVTMVRSFTGK